MPKEMVSKYEEAIRKEMLKQVELWHGLPEDISLENLKRLEHGRIQEKNVD